MLIKGAQVFSKCDTPPFSKKRAGCKIYRMADAEASLKETFLTPDNSGNISATSAEVSDADFLSNREHFSVESKLREHLSMPLSIAAGHGIVRLMALHR